MLGRGVVGSRESELLTSFAEDEGFQFLEGDVTRANYGYIALHNKIYILWRPSLSFQLMDIENGYLLAKFQSTEDSEKVFSQGPWTLDYKLQSIIGLPEHCNGMVSFAPTLGVLLREKVMPQKGGEFNSFGWKELDNDLFIGGRRNGGGISNIWVVGAG
ncbi:hypothetical protein Gohar_017356 [Gossypium harknessii]|uniref:DUF4283 domain-containing protein n=1 Tax=Gossypium harknessii TaxID=34285 RepID=A0A7J9G5L4_9ROSI|nr:hypothetical protein [Gossypium harknessii]